MLNPFIWLKEGMPPKGHTVNKAIQIVVSDTVPVQIDCYPCRQSNKSSRPDQGNCLFCREHIPNPGKPNNHIEGLDGRDAERLRNLSRRESQSVSSE